MIGGIIKMIVATHHDVEDPRTLDRTRDYDFPCTLFKVGLNSFGRLKFSRTLKNNIDT
jgi:hypothetical protein